MLVPAAQQESQGGLAQLAARARRLQRSVFSAEPLLGDGVGISPLRATAGLLGSGGTSALVDPPPAGYGVLEKLQAQVATTSPLYAGLTPGTQSGEDGVPSLGRLQASLVRARLDFARLDNSSRALQAARNPLRSQGGFGLGLLASTLDLLG
ncbi:MAG: hypothetical protein AB1505_11335 [Candidatus Latescibacterota bacterium]